MVDSCATLWTEHKFYSAEVCLQVLVACHVWVELVVTGKTDGLLAYRASEDLLVEVLGQSYTLAPLVGTRTRKWIASINESLLVLKVMQLVEDYRIVEKEQLQVLRRRLRHASLDEAAQQMELLVHYVVLESVFGAIYAEHVPARVKLKCVQSVRPTHALALA